MSQLFRPALALLNRLRYPQKFALISFCLLAPLFVALSLFFTGLNTQIASTRRELAGTAYLRPTQALLERALLYKLLIAPYVSDDPTLQAEVARAQQQVEVALQNLVTADRATNDGLQTRALLNELLTTWAELQNVVGRRDAPATQRLQQTFIMQLNDLTRQVGDNANLILDPELDSYYLMDAVVISLPRTQDLLAQTLQMTERIIRREFLVSAELEQLIGLHSQLRASHLQTQRGVAVAFRSEPTGQLRTQLTPAFRAAQQTNDDLLDRLAREMFQGDAVNMSLEIYQREGAAALRANAQLWQQTADALDEALHARIQRFTRQQQLTVALTVGALLLAAYLWFAFYRGLMNTIAELRQASQRLVSGDVSRVVTLATRDEMGQVITSFNTVAAQLRHEWQQAREESARATAAEAAARASEARHRLLLELSPDPIATYDWQGRINYINKAFAQTFGWTLAQLQDQALAFEPDGARAPMRAMLQQLFATKQRQVFETKRLTAAGYTLDVQISMSSVTDQVGESTESVVVLRDITERKRAELTLQRQNEYLATLHRITPELLNRRIVDELLYTVIERVTALMNAPQGYVMLVKGDKLVIQVVKGEGSIFQKREYVRGEAPLSWKAYDTLQPQVVQDYTSEITSHPGVVTNNSRATAIIPIIANDKCIGLLGVWRFDSTQPFTPEQIQFATLFAQITALALNNAKLFQDSQQHATQLATINSIGRALSAQLNLDTLITLVGNKLPEVFAAQVIYVAVYDRATKLIHFPYFYDHGETRADPPLPLGSGLSSRIIQTRQPLLLNHPEDIDALGMRNYAGPRAHSYLGVPIMLGIEAIGVISVQNTEQSEAYSKADMSLLMTIAANVGVAMNNAQLYTSAQREREYFAALVRNSPVAIVTTDLQMRVAAWNPAAEKLFGYTQSEALGQPIDDLVAQSGALHAEAVRYSQKTSQKDFVHQLTQRTRKDGALVDVEVLALPVVVANEMVGTIAIYHDITELQRAREAAEVANRAKSAFLATMSHEIRTPMNAIIGMGNLLLNTPLNTEQREFADTIHRSSEALLTIINDILDFSKIEAGRMELEYRAFDLRACIEGALDVLKLKAAEKGLELAYLMEPDVPASIISDETRVRQVILNLLSNAVKFTEQGEVVIWVTLAREMSAQRSADKGRATHQVLHIAVRDTGIGIPADRLDRLFQSFSQVDASTTRKYGGTGLGLAISQRLSELLGGALWVESVVGQGSTFHFTLSAEPAPDFKPPVPFDEEPTVLRGKRLLIVDDNATNRRILSLLTERWGLISFATASPHEALAWVQRGDPFDLAILDMQMPVMDGVILATEIRKSRDAHALPVVLCSSTTVLEGNVDAAGFAAQLSKPLKPSSLFNLLLNLLGRGQPSAPRATPSVTPSTFDRGMGRRLPLRILLAEDNVTNQRLALLMLERLGYSADVAENGLQVLAALQRQAYDVILMDVQMPEMDGLDTTRHIRQTLNAAQQPQIIAMTANAMQGDRELCLQAGMNDYISKPIYREALVKALSQCRPLAASAALPNETPPVHTQSLESALDDAEAETEPTLPASGSLAATGESNATIEAAAIQRLQATLGKRATTMLPSLIEGFCKEAPQLHAKAQQALAQGKMDVLRRAAHTLKSNAANFGAQDLAAVCLELETLVRAGHTTGAEDLLARINAEVQRAQASLTHLLSEWQAQA